MRRFGCFLSLLLAVFLLVCCVLTVFLPRRASASPAELTPWPYDYPTPAPYPTQIAIPTVCASPQVWSAPDVPICGIASVSVAHANGEGGYQLATFVATLFGLTFIGVCVLVVGLVKR
jgi:hypothetical protein